LRRLDTPREFGNRLRRLDPESGSEAFAAAGGGRDYLEMLGADILEELCLGAALDDMAQIGERDRLFMDLEFADLGELADKIPQPKFVEVHLPALDRHFMHHRNLLRIVAGFLRFFGRHATW